MEAFRRRVQSFLSPPENEKEKAPAAALKERRLANLHQVMALDNALKGGAGFGLARFGPPVAERVQALGKDEKRFWVNEEEVPPAMQADLGTRQRRSCIFNTVTQGSRLEINWRAHRPSLFQTVDQGSVGWVSRHWLYFKAGLRGGYQFDIHHRRHNDILNSYRSCGVWYIQLEYLVVGNFILGPWLSNSNWNLVCEAGREFFKSFTFDNQLFKMCYPWIAVDLNRGVEPAGFGTAEHAEELWAQLPYNPIFVNKGFAAKTSRWFSWSQKVSGMMPNLSVLLLVLLYISIHRGNISSTRDVPEFLVPAAKAPAPAGSSSSRPSPAAGSSSDLAPPSSSGAERLSVKQSNSEMERLRRSNPNTLMMVVHILSNRTTRRIAQCMLRLTSHVHEAHNLTVTQLKTQSGSLDWHVEAATGSYNKYLSAIFSELTDDGLLCAANFATDPESILSDSCFKEEALVAETALDLAREMIFNEIVSMAFYTHRPFAKFAALLHHDSNKRADAFKWCKELFEALTNAEEAVHSGKHPKLQQFLDSMLWPKALWGREILISIAEAQFQALPEAQAREVQGVFRGMTSTKGVEDAFGNCSEECGGSKAGKLGRTARFHRVAVSPLLQEMDRPPVVIDNRAKYASSVCSKQQRLAMKLYEGCKSEPSLGHDVMSSLTSERQDRFVES